MKKKVFIKHYISEDGNPDVNGYYMTNSQGSYFIDGKWTTSGVSWWQDLCAVELNVLTDKELKDIQREFYTKGFNDGSDDEIEAPYSNATNG